MPRFFANKKLILLLVGMIFLVALVSFSLRDRYNATFPERIIKDTVGVAQSIVMMPTNYVVGIFSNIDALLNTFEENKRLKAQLEDFAVLQTELTDVKSENEKLRALVDKKESLKAYDALQATVISRNPDQWEEKLIIDKGSVHGVKKNMAVLTANGLIGKIILVTPYTSEVELLYTNNPNYRVSAMVQGEKEVYGLIEGYDEEKNKLIMKRIDSNFEVKKGATVVSSGLGGIFPKGVLIGKITEISTDDFGLTKMAYVEPSADFSIIEHVVIAKRTITTIDGSDGTNTSEDLTNSSKGQATAGEE